MQKSLKNVEFQGTFFFAFFASFSFRRIFFGKISSFADQYNFRGFIRKKNWKEAIQRYKQISRINEGMPWQLDVKVGEKLISLQELE